MQWRLGWTCESAGTQGECKQRKAIRHPELCEALIMVASVPTGSGRGTDADAHLFVKTSGIQLHHVGVLKHLAIHPIYCEGQVEECYTQCEQSSNLHLLLHRPCSHAGSCNMYLPQISLYTAANTTACCAPGTAELAEVFVIPLHAWGFGSPPHCSCTMGIERIAKLPALRYGAGFQSKS